MGFSSRRGDWFNLFYPHLFRYWASLCVRILPFLLSLLPHGLCHSPLLTCYPLSDFEIMECPWAQSRFLFSCVLFACVISSHLSHAFLNPVFGDNAEITISGPDLPLPRISTAIISFTCPIQHLMDIASVTWANFSHFLISKSVFPRDLSMSVNVSIIHPVAQAKRLEVILRFFISLNPLQWRVLLPNTAPSSDYLLTVSTTNTFVSHHLLPRLVQYPPNQFPGFSSCPHYVLFT